MVWMRKFATPELMPATLAMKSAKNFYHGPVLRSSYCGEWMDTDKHGFISTTKYTEYAKTV